LIWVGLKLRLGGTDEVIGEDATEGRLSEMSKEIKLLVAALRMALREPGSVGQGSLSMALGADNPSGPRATADVRRAI